MPLFIPIILGTPRKGRESAKVAEFLEARLKNIPEVDTQIIDVDTFDLSHDENGGLAEKNPGYREIISKSDGFVIVSPEYNHSFPGHLKSMLDMAYPEYDKKAVGLVGVSAGGFGGTRAIESLLSVVKALGLATLKKDLNVSKVKEVFDENGKPIDPKFLEKTDAFLEDVAWLSSALKSARS